MKNCKFCNEEIEEKRADAVFCSNNCRSNHSQNIKKNRIYLHIEDGKFRLTLKKGGNKLVIFDNNAEQTVLKYGHKWLNDPFILLEILNL